MYLSGGPGGAGVFEMIDVLLTVPSLLDRFNVIGFDQRGTGASGLLRCPAIERDGRLRSTSAGERCARAAGRAAGVLHDARTPSRTWRRSARPLGRPEAHAVRDLLRHDARARLRARISGAGRAADPRLRRRPGRQRPVRARRLPRDAVRRCASLCRPGCVVRRSRPRTSPRSSPGCGATPLRGDVVHRGREARRARPCDPVAIADLLYDADYRPRCGPACRRRSAPALAGDAAPLLRLLRISAGFAFRRTPRTSRPPATRPCARRRRCRGRAGRRGRPPRASPARARRRSGRRRSSRSTPDGASRTRSSCACAGPIPAGRRARGRRLPGRAGAAAPGRGGPADAARGLGAHRVAAPAVDARDRAGRRARRGRRPTRATAASGSCGAGSRAAACGRAARAWGPACPRRDGAAGLVPRGRTRRGVTGSGGDPGVRRTVAALDATLADLGFAVSPGAFGGERGGGLRGGTLRLDVRGRLHRAAWWSCRACG